MCPPPLRCCSILPRHHSPMLSPGLVGRQHSTEKQPLPVAIAGAPDKGWPRALADVGRLGSGQLQPPTSPPEGYPVDFALSLQASRLLSVKAPAHPPLPPQGGSCQLTQVRLAPSSLEAGDRGGGLWALLSEPCSLGQPRGVRGAIGALGEACEPCLSNMPTCHFSPHPLSLCPSLSCPPTKVHFTSPTCYTLTLGPPWRDRLAGRLGGTCLWACHLQEPVGSGEVSLPTTSWHFPPWHLPPPSWPHPAASMGRGGSTSCG